MMKPLNVLLVEDIPSDAFLIEEMLKSSVLREYNIVKAASLKEAFEKLENGRFDVIIADLGLPDSNGLDTIKAILAKAPHLPAIVLTGNNDEQSGNEAVLNGAQDYLVKWAINSDQLTRSIRYAVNRKKVGEKLIASEEKFRKVIENIQLAGLMLDKECNITFANDFLLKLTGWSRDEIIGKNWIEHFIPKALQPKISRVFSELLSSQGFPSAYENEIITRDGKILVISWSNMVHFGPNGKPVSLTSIGENITKQIETQKELAANEKRYRSIVEDQAQAIVRYKPDGALTFVNDSFCQMIGKSSDDLIGRSYFSFIDPKHLGQVLNKVQKLDKVHPVEISEYKILSPDGKKRWQQWTNRAIWGNDGLIAEFQAEGIDITNLKLAEQALKESEQKFRTIVEASPDAVITSGLKGLINFASKRAALLLEYKDSTELHGKSLVDLIAPENKDKALKSLEKIRQKKVPKDTLFIMLKKGGQRFYGEVSTAVITGERGSAKGFISIIKDVSERKNTENAIIAYQQNLRSMASELNLAEEKERRRIATDLHDDLGQSLAMARIKLSGLKSENLEQRILDDLLEMEKHITHAIKGSRTLTYELSPPVLYEFGLAAAINWKLEQLAAKYGLEAQMEVGEGIPQLSENHLIMLFRSVSELLNNIVKHARAKKVSVTVAMDGKCMNILVSDDGEGFNTADLELKSKTTGSIGLFSIKERLDYFDGTMTIDTANGKGTKIYLSIPVIN